MLDRPPTNPAQLHTRSQPPNSRGRPFQPVDYARYRTQCDIEKRLGIAHSVARSDHHPTPISFSSCLSQTGLLPALCNTLLLRSLRDAAQTIALLFTLGSLLFTTHASLLFLPLFAPHTALAVQTSSLAIPVTDVAASALFLLAAVAAFPATWNAENGTLEPAGVGGQDGGSAMVFRPAMVGDAEWVWWPGLSDLRVLGRTSAVFRAAVVQFGGAVLLLLSAVLSVPGVLSKSSPGDDDAGGRIAVSVLLSVGGAMLMISHPMMVPQSRLSLVGWLAPVAGGLGGLCFALGGGLLFANEALGASIARLVGSLAFLFASVVGWCSLGALRRR